MLAKDSKGGGGVHLAQENQDLFWMVQMGLSHFPRMRSPCKERKMVLSEI